MKTILTLAAFIALAAGAAHAHHENAYGIFWKDGKGPRVASASAAGEIWRFAFVSKYRW